MEELICGAGAVLNIREGGGGGGYWCLVWAWMSMTKIFSFIANGVYPNLLAIRVLYAQLVLFGVIATDLKRKKKKLKNKEVYLLSDGLASLNA